MKKSTIFKQSILFFAMGLTTVMATAQAIITIDNNANSTTTYTTIQDAHDNAAAGDIIYVQPSPTSYGEVTIDKALTIVGRSHSEPNKRSQIGNITLRSSNVTIKGMYISSFNSSTSGSPNPIPYTDISLLDNYASSISVGSTPSPSAPLEIDGMTIRGNVINAQFNMFNADNVLVSNNVFTSNQPFTLYRTEGLVIANNVFKTSGAIAYLYSYDTTQPAVLFNNMFIFNSNSASEVNVPTGDFALSNNLTYNYGSSQVSLTESGSGTISESNTLANTDPQFTDVDATVYASFAGIGTYNPATRLEDDLTLQAGSPALTGGVGGDEIGLYANGFRYQVIGNPSGVPLLDITSYDAAAPKNGNINVTITAKAN